MSDGDTEPLREMHQFQQSEEEMETMDKEFSDLLETLSEKTGLDYSYNTYHIHGSLDIVKRMLQAQITIVAPRMFRFVPVLNLKCIKHYVVTLMIWGPLVDWINSSSAKSMITVEDYASITRGPCTMMLWPGLLGTERTWLTNKFLLSLVKERVDKYSFMKFVD